MYEIQPRTKQIAKKLGLIVFPSENPKYKIEIYDRNGLFLFYGGHPDFSDYPTYLKTHGKEFADERKRLYRIRHKKELDDFCSRGWIVAKLLWS